MSFEAINQVTRGLRRLLATQLTQISPGAVVTLLPPGDQLPEVSGINLYLYRVMESAFTKNRPWPGDRATAPSDRPALGLQLFYLLTPLGTRPANDSDAGDDAHTMLGLAMSTLQENPVLNNVHLPTFEADTELPDFLLNSYEQIKMMLLPTSIDELSKIWATINQPYRLSVAYEVSLVEIAPTPPPPVGGGIVLTTGVDVITFDPPRLSELTPGTGALARIPGATLTANQLRIDGFGLSFPGQTPIVKVGGQQVQLIPLSPPTDETLMVTLPTDVDGGPQVDVTVKLNGRTSRPLVFNVNPWLTSITPIRTALDPTHGPLDLTLHLTGTGFTPPAAVRFEGPGPATSVAVFDPGGTDTHQSITIPTTLANGVYRVRLVLGDVASSATNSRTLEVIPRIDSPIGISTTVVDGNNVHRLTINGARLNGSDVRAILDGATYQRGANANAAQFVLTLGRLLNSGTHRVSLNINGQVSRTVTFEI
jgi:Pvc16 N-terminal domain